VRDREIYIERINYQTFSRDLDFERKSLYAIHFVFFGGNNQLFFFSTLNLDVKSLLCAYILPAISLDIDMGFIFEKFSDFCRVMGSFVWFRIDFLRTSMTTEVLRPQDP
jgi:hypothetical protein